jgi:hypothetical protein
MDWRDRRIWIALGLAAASGLVFGMLLDVLGGGGGGAGPTGAVEQTQPASEPSDSDEPGPTESTTPSPTSTEYPDNDFGYLTGIEEEDGHTVLVFDRATLLTGEAAREEAERRGQEANNDYFITNDNRRLRDRVVAGNATATGSQILTGQPQPTPVSLQQVYDFVRAHPGQLAVYLHYDDDNEVVKIDEVYFP